MDAHLEDGPDGPEIHLGDHQLTLGEAARLSRRLSALVSRGRGGAG